MKILEHGPFAGNSGNLSLLLSAYARQHKSAPGMCIRGPFVVDVTHKTLTSRRLPERYMDAELRWFHTDSDNVVDLAREYGKTPTEWLRVAAPDGTINGQYGWCIWSADTGHQYRNALETLTDDSPRNGRDSRRAVMVYTHRHFREWAGRQGAMDPMCTVSVQVLWTPPGRALYIAHMRATDAIFGYTADMNWHRHVLMRHLLPDLPAEWSRADPRLVLVTGSIQVYEQHMELVRDCTGALEPMDYEMTMPCDAPGEYRDDLKGFVK